RCGSDEGRPQGYRGERPAEPGYPRQRRQLRRQPWSISLSLEGLSAMSALSLRLVTPPAERLDMSGLIPAHLARLTIAEISRIALGKEKNSPRVGDYFKVHGEPGDALVIEAGGGHLD